MAERRFIFNEVLDEKLLGGFKIEVNDEIIDLTIKNKLEKLQEYLTRNNMSSKSNCRKFKKRDRKFFRSNES